MTDNQTSEGQRQMADTKMITPTGEELLVLADDMADYCPELPLTELASAFRVKLPGDVQEATATLEAMRDALLG
jgi:hypothetical protein